MVDPVGNAASDGVASATAVPVSTSTGDEYSEDFEREPPQNVAAASFPIYDDEVYSNFKDRDFTSHDADSQEGISSLGIFEDLSESDAENYEMDLLGEAPGGGGQSSLAVRGVA